MGREEINDDHPWALSPVVARWRFRTHPLEFQSTVFPPYPNASHVCFMHYLCPSPPPPQLLDNRTPLGRKTQGRSSEIPCSPILPVIFWQLLLFVIWPDRSLKDQRRRWKRDISEGKWHKKRSRCGVLDALHQVKPTYCLSRGQALQLKYLHTTWHQNKAFSFFVVLLTRNTAVPSIP